MFPAPNPDRHVSVRAVNTRGIRRYSAKISGSRGAPINTTATNNGAEPHRAPIPNSGGDTIPHHAPADANAKKRKHWRIVSCRSQQASPNW